MTFTELLKNNDLQSRAEILWRFSIPFLNTLLVLLVLVSLSALFSFIGELDDVGKGDYSVKTALVYIVLRMPGIAYELFPSSVLLGSLRTVINDTGCSTG